MDLNLTEPQSEFFSSDGKATAMVTGFGAGKTTTLIARMLATKFRYPNLNLFYGAPTYSLIRDILYPEFEEMMGEAGFSAGKDYIINRGDNNIIFPGAGLLMCRTLDKPERLVGFQVGDVFLDEFDTLKSEQAKQVWTKIIARARKQFPDGKKNQIWVGTTPEGFRETYRMFVQEKKENYVLIQAPTSSNPHLPDDYVDTLLDTYPDELVSAYVDGQFTNLRTGRVYRQFDRELNNTHYVAKPRETLHIGMDFNVGKMSAIIHVIRESRPYAVAEILGRKDTPDMIDAIKELHPEHPVIVYPDSTGGSRKTVNASTSDIQLLRDAGFRIDAPKANPLIKDRVVSVNAMFCNAKGDRRYKVNIERCPNFVLTLEQQSYDSNGIPDKDHDQDHPNDAAGYFIHRRFPAQRHRLVQRSLPT